ncbi:hypothetical protein Q1695_005008 [Nippostrongylus brasiliensis]|nr:hypothetical protein Q1695_005008 [Nippostrongylus brasiliensis]
MFGVTRFIQARDGILSSELRRQSMIRHAVAWAKLSKISWGGHVMRFRDDRWTKAVTDWIPWDIRTPGRPPLRLLRQTPERSIRCSSCSLSKQDPSTIAHDSDEWRRHWRTLEQIDDQREQVTCDPTQP